MTAGHKHRLLRVRRGGLVQRALCRPLWHTRSKNRVMASPFVYGPCALSAGSRPTCWTTSALGILHGLFGLTLKLPVENDDG